MIEKFLSWFKSNKEVGASNQPPKKNPTSTVKVTDFPRTLYDAHWETVNNKDGTTVCRIYSNAGKLLTYSTFEGPDRQAKVDTFVKTKMEAYRKK